MPQKKKFEAYEYRNISSFVVPTPEIISLFQSHLLELPIFKKGQKNDIILHTPEYPPKTLGEKAGPLLEWLSSTLGSFFRDIRIDPESFSETMTKMTMALNEFSSCKNELITSGIISEKTFKKIFDVIDKLRKGYLEHIASPIPSAKRTKLVKELFDGFKESIPRFQSNAVFYCIAHILKGFEIEKGNIEQIFGRIKVDFYRKKEASFPPPID